MRDGRRAPVTVLVYHPAHAARYAALVDAPRGRVRVRVARSAEEAASAIADAQVLYAWDVPARLYARAARLRWLQVMGAGVDAALVPELPPDVTVTRAPGVFGAWMAEYVLGWCAWVTQRMATYLEAQRARRWAADVLPDRLRGRTLTIVGLGDIGRTIARAARGLGMRVLGVSRTGADAREADRVYRPRDLRRALAAADFVALTLPLTAPTRGLIGARELAAMRPTAALVNCARGGLVDEQALASSLREGRLAGAGLDVFEQEPPPVDHPLLQLNGVIVSPHIAGATED
ncbi:MAG: D-2-hydroxyacid dehydrogenase, partial [Candidatus Rokubacteria bacterium]|nr:D-2-hydroxyacid dehydrogenase [Candidatus Rokubacteria bacterium]